MLQVKTKEQETLQNKIDLVKYIVQYKLDKIDSARVAKENAEKKQKIMEIIEKKQNASLEEKSVDELLALLDDLK